MLFAGGALFVKFKLESSRADIELALEERLGAHLSTGAISVNGLRGLRIDDFKVTLADPGGPHVRIENRLTLVDIDLTDLLYGKITVDRIVLNNSSVTITRPETVDWYDPEQFDAEAVLPLETGDSFRLTGNNCHLSILNVVGDTRIDVERFRFDISRLKDANDIVATFAGDLSGNPDKRIDVKLTYADLQDFDLRVQTRKLTAEDVNVFLPSPRRLVEEGEMQPTVWINGRPDNTIVLSVQAPFEKVVVQEHPDFLDPAGGMLTFLATYETDGDLLSITTAKVDSPQLGGSIEGTISFTDTFPEFDLRLTASHMPTREILNYALEGRLEEYGDIDLTLNEPHELLISLTGTSENPVVTGNASAGSGEFRFTPHDDQYPALDLALGTIHGSWDSESQSPMASFTVLDGTVHHAETDIKGENVYGTVTIENRVVMLSPVNATVTGNAATGSLVYNLDTGDGNVTFEGTFAQLEDAAFTDSISVTTLAGSVGLRCTASKTGDQYTVDAHIDATQSTFDYAWWFEKPLGIGANGLVHVEFVPDKSAVITVDADIASSRLEAKALVGHSGEDGWYLDSCVAKSDLLDVNAVGKCLKLPYKLTGSTATDGHFEWRRDLAHPDGWTETMGCTIEEISVVPIHEDAGTPISCTDVTLVATIQSGPLEAGSIKLDAGTASTPSFGEVWFVDLRPEDEEDPNRDWTYELSAASLTLPPWKGTNFTAVAYSKEETSGFNRYAADIEEGHISGDYHSINKENSYRTAIAWENVPANYFIEHLNYPDVLSGNVSGEVSYFLDVDDPNTLSGDGNFEVRDGQFSADFLYSLLKGKVEDELATLPPSLEFSRLSIDVRLHEDVVETPVIMLVSEGLELNGSGSFIKDGDMDYDIEISVTPDTAGKIPLLAENFNIQSLQVTQQNLELPFHIYGPTFNPRGELAGLPPTSVTLVGGAFDVAGEAAKIIDLPRRILIDLLKMGGGIVAGGS